MGKNKPVTAYRHGNSLYFNITNRCPTDCSFCFRTEAGYVYEGHDLNLRGYEPSPADLLREASLAYGSSPFSEIVFCGFGEPAMRFEQLKETAARIRAGEAQPVPNDIPIRLNTNGLANLITGRKVIQELKGLINTVSVSLNASSEEEWRRLMRPYGRYAGGFRAVLDFISESAKTLPETVITAIGPGPEEEKKIRKLAAGLGASVRIRQLINPAREKAARREPALSAAILAAAAFLLLSAGALFARAAGRYYGFLSSWETAVTGPAAAQYMAAAKNRPGAPASGAMPELHFHKFSANFPGAKKVGVSADFNKWNSSFLELSKNKKGIWEGMAPLPPGTYHYLYEVDGEFLPDPAFPPATDSRGKEVSVLVINEI